MRRKRRKMIWVRAREPAGGAAWARDGGGCVRGAGVRSVRACVNFKDGSVASVASVDVVNFPGGSTSAPGSGRESVGAAVAEVASSAVSTVTPPGAEMGKGGGMEGGGQCRVMAVVINKKET